MAKRLIQHSQRHLNSSSIEAQETQSVITMDDNTLPTPAELKEYMELSPKIVEHFLEVSAAEQKHRHELEKGQAEIIKIEVKRTGRMHFWSIFFATLVLLSLIALIGYALYLDRPWIASVTLLFAIASAISIYTAHIKKDKPQ